MKEDLSEDLIEIQLLINALDRLEEGLHRYKENPEDELIRDGVIQRFEFCYEVSVSTIKRFLKLSVAQPATVDAMSFQELIRTAHQKGVLAGNWPEWKSYRKARGSTSHVYSAPIAEEVFHQIPAFFLEARYLEKHTQLQMEKLHGFES